jgi:hypothetical protein
MLTRTVASELRHAALARSFSSAASDPPRKNSPSPPPPSASAPAAPPGTDYVTLFQPSYGNALTGLGAYTPGISRRLFYTPLLWKASFPTSSFYVLAADFALSAVEPFSLRVFQLDGLGMHHRSTHTRARSLPWSGTVLRCSIILFSVDMCFLMLDPSTDVSSFKIINSLRFQDVCKQWNEKYSVFLIQ